MYLCYTHILTYRHNLSLGVFSAEKSHSKHLEEEVTNSSTPSRGW